MNKRTLRLICLCVTAALGISIFTGCSVNTSGNKNSIANGKINVYTSFYAMYDFAKKIGGDKINLTNLVPAGTEPHDWEPSPTDIARLEKADVIIYNGAGMEGWIEKVLKTLGNKKLITVEAAKELKLSDNTDTAEELKSDPHLWLNPMFAKKQMELIKNTFVTADPSSKDYFEKNYADNAKKIDALNTEFTETVSKFKSKDIIVAHKAFGYLCSTYGLRQVAIEGLAADSEPSPSRMAEIVKFARKNNVKYIFFEELVSPKIAETIAKEVGAKTGTLNPLEGLKEEDLAAGKEYFSVMRENLEALKNALQ